ncbi:GspE/PulE family protein [Candidatus Gracilibacteria bacterium]|nr:GspE/PulE family protein [Candidatus Gracilibacteria bacterium]
MDLKNIFKNQDKKEDTNNSALNELFGGENSIGNEIKTENKILEKDFDVEEIFQDALSRGASDIHIEPDETNLNIRFRVDGTLVNYKTLDESYKSSLIARIKVLGGLKIDERRLPQDGKASFNEKKTNTSIDLRINVIPTIYGEKIAIRLLKKENEWVDLRTIGILPMNMVRIKKHLADNFGLCLVVGPTGSGKSTTLYAMLSTFDTVDKNISTLEDPVEYRIKGVNHTQINPAINFNFADGLRSLLRQDPDIIMVGEIRDSETAKLSVEASITGHIVFSTIHANSSVSTIQRLVNLGIDPLLIVSSLRMIISQRLARKLCPHCKIKYKPEEIVKEKVIKRIGKYINPNEELFFYKVNETGCEKCNHKGYKGRTGIYEILEMTDGLEKLILAGASNTQLEIQAIGDGMVNIKDDALLKVALGEISLEEVFNILGN